MFLHGISRNALRVGKSCPANQLLSQSYAVKLTRTATCEYHVLNRSQASPLSQRLSIVNRNFPSHRHVTTYATPVEKFRRALKEARQENPILFPFLVVACIGAVSLLSLMAYDEYTRVAPQYVAYPGAVEQNLRLALHFTHVSPDPDTAAYYFRGAIKETALAGLDPFSDIAMGIKIRYAGMLEHFGRAKASVTVLESLAKECEEKLEDLDRESLSSRNVVDQAVSGKDAENLAMRKTLVKGITQIKFKIAELYHGDYLQDSTTAKAILSDAVGLLVQEARDPTTNSFTDEKGPSLMDIASTLALMGDLYSTTGEEENAIQVYMLTLEPLRKACNGSRSCKEVQIFSNIASAMREALKKPGAKVNGKPATRESLAAGRMAGIAWADQAIGTTAKIEEAEKDQICASALLSAQITKGYLLLDGGDKASAGDLFKKILPSIREKSLSSVIPVVEDGLRRATS